MLITFIAFGPFAYSAEKLDASTLNSCTNSVFGLTEVAQLQPGSAPGAPSTVMSSDIVRVPFAEKLPIALWLLPPPPWYSPLPLIPITSPVKPGRLVTPWVIAVMPGSTRSSSAALEDTIGMFSIVSAVSVVLFSPLLSGVSWTSEVTDTVSAIAATFKRTSRSERLSPARSPMPVTSKLWNPCSATSTLYVLAGTAEKAKKPLALVTERRTRAGGLVRERDVGARHCRAGVVDDRSVELRRHSLGVRGARQAKHQSQKREREREPGGPHESAVRHTLFSLRRPRRPQSSCAQCSPAVNVAQIKELRGNPSRIFNAPIS